MMPLNRLIWSCIKRIVVVVASNSDVIALLKGARSMGILVRDVRCQVGHYMYHEARSFVRIVTNKSRALVVSFEDLLIVVDVTEKGYR